MLQDTPEYKRAKARVEALKGFFVHLSIYLVVNLFLLTLNLLTTPDRLWFYWPLLGWGIGLTIHGIVVFALDKFFGPEWEEREIQKRLQASDGTDQHQRPAA